jgi:Glyoxalase-like domain
VSSVVGGPDGGQAVHRVQVSFDSAVGDLPHGDERRAAVREHAQRLVASGATLVGERHDVTSWWAVLTDPEGNESCLR